jgi:L-ascorbate metabolism protein UlaG (beta-lactamase superfamily)
MELTFHGQSCIRLRGREATVLVDPPQGAHASRTAPDILVRTEGATEPEKLRPQSRPQEVSGAGEFEVRGVSIFGMPAGDTTLMRIEVDDVRVLAAGRLRRQLAEDEIDALGHVDVLVVPVGGGDSLNAAEATKLVNAVEPGIVVPVRYRLPDSSDEQYETVDKFAKEMGLAEGTWSRVPRLSLSGPSSESEEIKVVVLEARG